MLNKYCSLINDQASSPSPCPECLCMVLLKGFPAAQEYPASETPALRWNHTKKKKHLPSKEPTEGIPRKWPEALESSISRLSVTSLSFKDESLMGKENLNLLWIHLPPLLARGDGGPPSHVGVWISHSMVFTSIASSSLSPINGCVQWYYQFTLLFSRLLWSFRKWGICLYYMVAIGKCKSNY